MSVEAWKAEFYPIEAADTDEEAAVAHSLRKWEGVRADALERHRLISRNGGLEGIEGESPFDFGANTCALCEWYQADDCEACPLYRVRGDVSCDSYTYAEHDARTRPPYQAFTLDNNPEPMILWLKLAKELL